MAIDQAELEKDQMEGLCPHGNFPGNCPVCSAEKKEDEPETPAADLSLAEMSEPQPQYIQFANLGIEHDEEAQKYFLEHKQEIEQSEATAVNAIIDFFNNNYKINSHPELIPASKDDRTKLMRNDLYNLPTGEAKRLRQLSDELVSITKPDGTKSGNCYGTTSKAIESFWGSDIGKSISSDLASDYPILAESIRREVTNVAQAELEENFYHAELGVQTALCQSLLADEYGISKEEAAELPVFWLHGMPIENVPDAVKEGCLMSQQELVMGGKRHTALSGASLTEKGFNEHEIKLRYHPNIYGDLEFGADIYTGYVPGEAFRSREEAESYVEVHEHDPEYKKLDDGMSLEEEYYRLDIQEPLPEAKDPIWRIKSEAWEAYFYKPVQVISKEARLTSLPIANNDAYSGVSFAGRIPLSSGRFSVRSEMAKKYLLESGVNDDDILLISDPGNAFLFEKSRRNKLGKRRKISEYGQ